MIKLKSIKMVRGEGPTELCDKPTTVSTYQEASIILGLWARTAPKDGGYNKCDVVLTFEDGLDTQVRIDLQHQHVKGYDVAEHARKFLGFVAGTYRPPHMTEKQFEEVLKKHTKAQRTAAERFLQTHDLVSPIEPEATKPVVQPEDAVRHRFNNLMEPSKLKVLDEQDHETPLKELCEAMGIPYEKDVDNFTSKDLAEGFAVPRPNGVQ